MMKQKLKKLFGKTTMAIAAGTMLAATVVTVAGDSGSGSGISCAPNETPCVANVNGSTYSRCCAKEARCVTVVTTGKRPDGSTIVMVSQFCSP
ncbi:MAG: hypothetical protein M2R45_05289 [Verrucomicrobia subdivision 3 bacterium]|nr:hypothetical protein [Limisphaerales bacterium]